MLAPIASALIVAPDTAPGAAPDAAADPLAELAAQLSALDAAASLLTAMAVTDYYDGAWLTLGTFTLSGTFGGEASRPTPPRSPLCPPPRLPRCHGPLLRSPLRSPLSDHFDSGSSSADSAALTPLLVTLTAPPPPPTLGTAIFAAASGAVAGAKSAVAGAKSAVAGGAAGGGTGRWLAALGLLALVLIGGAVVCRRLGTPGDDGARHGADHGAGCMPRRARSQPTYDECERQPLSGTPMTAPFEPEWVMHYDRTGRPYWSDGKTTTWSKPDCVFVGGASAVFSPPRGGGF